MRSRSPDTAGVVARGEAVDEQDVTAAGTRTADGDPGPIPEAG